MSQTNMDRQQGSEILKICTNIIGARDEYTQGHSHHVYVVTEAIFEAGHFPIDREKLAHAALLHDIGKILVPENVLNKDCSLSDEEWEIIRQHPVSGCNLLQGTMFEDIGDWILYHHERMDGKGYHGLSGDGIPLASRIIAVADTFSALRTYRAYRPAKSIQDTIRILKEAAGTQLDANVVQTLLSYDEDFLEALECNCEICKRRKEAEHEKALSEKINLQSLPLYR
ncbi:HD domain-containing protein [Synergistaceae bacterium OttesenSCG-928-I11]|nr:HD domain-containing protein [Synergistaceae bacterium OttesenSCG-928-I11]